MTTVTMMQDVFLPLDFSITFIGGVGLGSEGLGFECGHVPRSR